jgi:hypothetical protein
MANQLQNITIAAPAFKGLNTQDSPLSLDHTYAAVADHCVIDKYGRMGARKGIDVLTTGGASLGSSVGCVSIFEYTDTAANTTVFSTGNSLILSGTTTLVDETPAAYTITSDDWKIVSLADKCYFFQIDHEPLVYSTGTGAVEAMTGATGYSGTVQEGNEVLSAFGRLWVADITGDKHTIYWSDLLNGLNWNGGTSGSLDLTSVWPRGYDEVVALAAHNSSLVIFGKHSILVYDGADSPSTMSLVDTIDSVGCVSRDTVQAVGVDLLFLSNGGLRSLGRTIQEESLPMTDVSKNIRNDMLDLINLQTGYIKAVYSPENAFYLISFTDAETVVCFDVRGLLENGSYRATVWPSMTVESFCRADDGTLYIGTSSGICQYDGYSDEGANYILSYYSHPLAFGAPNNLKQLKSISATLIGGSLISGAFKWAYDYQENYTTRTFNLVGDTIAEYGVAEYGVAEYSISARPTRTRTNAGGSGSLVTIGMEATIDGSPFSLQELNIQSTIGRLA